MKSASMKVVNGAPDKPALTLAKAFDSYEATMRLAAMTGMDKELAGFADTAPHQNGSNAATRRSAARYSSRSDKSARRTRSQPRRHTRGFGSSASWRYWRRRRCLFSADELP